MNFFQLYKKKKKKKKKNDDDDDDDDDNDNDNKNYLYCGFQTGPQKLTKCLLPTVFVCLKIKGKLSTINVHS